MAAAALTAALGFLCGALLFFSTPSVFLSSPVSAVESGQGRKHNFLRDTRKDEIGSQKRSSRQSSRDFPVVPPDYPLSPVVMIPGIAGSGLLGQLENAEIPECGDESPRNEPWHRVWASLRQMLPPLSHQYCWASTMQLVPPKCNNNDTDIDNPKGCELVKSGPDSVYRGKPGVHVNPDSFGSTAGFEYLDYLHGIGVFGTNYFFEFVEAFRRVGYRDVENLFGFPYDWRYPPWELDLNALKNLIEEAKQKSDNRKVIIISHSLGSVVTTYFLNAAVDAQWKTDNIETFVSIGGAFGGSPKAVRSLLTGYNDPLTFDLFNVVNITLLPREVIRYFHQTTGSMYALTPSTEVYAENVPIVKLQNSPRPSNSSSEEVFVTSKRRLSSVPAHVDHPPHSNSSHQPPAHPAAPYHVEGMDVDSHLQKIFRGMDDSETERVYTSANWTLLMPSKMRALAEQARKYMPLMLQDPQVPVNCVWSRYDRPTTEITYQYGGNPNFDIMPAIGYTFGDNTLPMQSLKWCSRWASTTFSHEFANLDHMHVFQDSEFNRFMVSLLTGLTPPA